MSAFHVHDQNPPSRPKSALSSQKNCDISVTQILRHCITVSFFHVTMQSVPEAWCILSPQIKLQHLRLLISHEVKVGIGFQASSRHLIVVHFEIQGMRWIHALFT